MKHRVLLVGNNQTVINEFFVHMDNVFECQTCSLRHEDMASHIRYFEPEVMVFCAKTETRDNMQTVVNFHSMLEMHNIPLAFLGDMADYEAYKKMPNCKMELFIQRPISPNNIAQNIIMYITNKANAKRSLAGLKKTSEKATTTSKDTLELLAKVDAEIALIEKDGNKSLSNKKKILVVDDDATMLKTIKGHLDEKYNVSVATSGAVAKKFLYKKSVDLILLDYEMPYENGAEVMRSLRAMKNTCKTPIIFLTGVNDAAKIQEVISLKPQGYLLKPIEHDTLLSKINEVI